MLMLPFCGLASGEVKLVELTSMPGTPSLLQGDAMRGAVPVRVGDLPFFSSASVQRTKAKHDGKKD